MVLNPSTPFFPKRTHSVIWRTPPSLPEMARCAGAPPGLQAHVEVRDTVMPRHAVRLGLVS
jgi:hypothetical protein